MSKAALNMMTLQHARAYPRWRVNSATPGLTATEFAPAARAGHPVQEGAEISRLGNLHLPACNRYILPFKIVTISRLWRTSLGSSMQN
jgi:NAD(P)-dependent dehydrogenase (short-subunit alcohol dehydrogenase family)